MEKYDDFAFASKENMENLSKAYNNSLKVDALNTGESGNALPNQNSGGGTPNQQTGTVPIPNSGNNNVGTPVKTSPASSKNSLAQFNLLLFVMMLFIINGGTSGGGCGCSNRR